MPGWAYRYELAAGVDPERAMRFVAHYERMFGLLSVDESAVWSAAQVRRMCWLGIGPRHLWVGGALHPGTAAWLGRN